MPSKATVCNKTCPAGPPGNSLAGPPGHFTSNTYVTDYGLLFNIPSGTFEFDIDLIKNSDTQSAYVRILKDQHVFVGTFISTNQIPSDFWPDATETMVMQDSFNDLFTFSIDTSGYVTLQSSTFRPIPAGMQATYPLKIFP